MSKIAVIGLVGNSAFLSVDEFHQAGETIRANSIHFEPGGKGVNQAVAAARFGAEVSFLGAVGYEYKDEIINFLENEKIKHFIVQKNDSTAFATILTDKAGANQVTVYQGAKLNVEDVDMFADEISNADVLLINNEVPMSVNERAISIAKQNKVFVILNPAPSVDLSDFIKESVDLFTPNEFETDGIEEKDNLIVTLGARGCYIKSVDKIVESCKIENVVDTTGAGDTFNGVLAACTKEMTVEEAVKYATVAAGLSVTKNYAATSMPAREEIDRFVGIK